MIDNYNDIMESWANPSVGTCTDMMEITPSLDLARWSVQRTVTVLANSDYYYTRDEIDFLLNEITHNALTREQVEEMIQIAIASKANQSEVDAISEQVSQNTSDIQNRYTKQETNTILEAYLTKLKANEMFANYSKVVGTTLELNAE